MDSLLPTEIFALEVQPGETVPVIDAPASFRITMAAIDPTAPAIVDPENPNAPPRATLKMIRHYDPIEFDDEDDYDEDDDEDIDDEDVAAIERKLGLEAGADSEEDEEDSEAEAGPAKSKSKKAAKKLANGDGDVDMDEVPNGVNGVKKAKASADDEEDDDEDLDDEDDDEDDVELPLCTLDTKQHYQQALDLTVMDTSTVSFKVIGTHSIFLTGNFVEVPEDDDDDEDYSEDDEDDEYMTDLDRLVAPYGDEDDFEDEEITSEEDELDGLGDPRVEEVGSDEEEAAPKLVKSKASAAKGKNKRPAESEDEEADDLDKLISKTLKSGDAAPANGEQKLSKKQLKKLKKNDGQAAPAEDKKAAVKDSPGNGKKVQFAKELEQGPTPTKTDVKTDAKKDAKPQSKGVRVVQGITIDERKEGTGPGAKKGDRVGMRYIGKLEKDGKVFDSNKKGKPFTFKLGMNEVIKGWDIGLVGVKVGSERRLTIPANMAYGSQRLPDIPPNSTLIFDVKCLSIN